MINEFRFNWIQVNIIHLLHKSILTINFERVRMMLENRVLMLVLSFLDAKLRERRFKSIFLQVVKDALRRDAIYEAKHIRTRALAIGDQVEMVLHYHIGEDQNACGEAGFVQGFTYDPLHVVCLKYSQSLVGNRC